MTTLDACIDVIILTYLGSGSLLINTLVSGGNYNSADAASASIANTFSANTQLDGITVASSSSSASGYTTVTPTTSSTNLGLILGLSIPLLLLRNFALTQ